MENIDSMNPSTQSHLGSGRPTTIATIGAVFLVYLLMAWATYRVFTSRIPGGNDFYPRWRGTKALFTEGKDPYSKEVTLQIQQEMYGRPALEDEDQVAFAYPIYVSLMVLPLSFLPYPLAQAFWLSALVLAVLGTLVALLRTLEWKPPAVAMVGLTLWSILFYPTARSILLGQFSIIVLALLAFTVWALHQRKLFLAGSLLALSTVKPQMVFLVVPFLLFSTWRKGQYRTLAGFLSALGVLSVLSFVVLPTWIPSFASGLASYSSYTSIYREGRSPLGVLISYLLPSTLVFPTTVLVSVAILAYVLYAWARSGRNVGSDCMAFLITIVATVLLPAQTGTTNQVLLLLPFFYWLHEFRTSAAGRFALMSALLVAPWALFLLTFAHRKGEHAVMSVPLPLVAIGLLWWVQRKRGQREVGGSGEPVGLRLADDPSCGSASRSAGSARSHE
jgi:hypothetical protein